MPVPTPPTPLDPNSTNIWIAASEGNLPLVHHFLTHHHLLPTSPDEFTYTPLHAAASYNHLHILRYLLTHPTAPKNAVDTTDSDLDTPLFVCETVECARCLIDEFGANPRVTNAEGLTPAQQAWHNGHFQVADYIASITGEKLDPLLQQQQHDDHDDDGVEVGSRTTDQHHELVQQQQARLDEQTDRLMQTMHEIMTRAENQGFDPESELRQLVGESVLRQILNNNNISAPNPPHST